MKHDETSTSFHVVWADGVRHDVDKETRSEIESWLRLGEDGGQLLVFDTIHGEEVTVRRSFVTSLWSSTPETRARAREHQKLIDEEVPVEDR